MKNRNRWLFIAASIVFFLLFVAFTFVVKKDHLNQFDFNTTVRLQDHIPRKIDTFFSFLSLVGSFEVLTVILGLILLARRKLKGIIVFALYGSSHLIEISRNSCSFITRMSSFCALSNLLPAFSPATTHLVLLETLPLTRAPKACNFYVASSRPILSSVPVTTQLSPLS